MNPSKFLVAAAVTASSVVAIGFASAQSTPTYPATPGQTTTAPAQAVPADTGMQTAAPTDSTKAGSTTATDASTSGGSSTEPAAKADRN